MIHLDLTVEEQQALIDMIENCISDLRMEIRDTDRLDYRNMLKERKALMTKLVEALYQAREVEGNA